MINPDEIESLREQYKNYCLSCLFNQYIDLKGELDSLVELDEGSGVTHVSKELEIIVGEIKSRPLEDKKDLLKEMSEDLTSSDVNCGELSFYITYFITNFL
jgi:hypothetical protein